MASSGNVFAAFAQRRQIQSDDVDAVEEILAEAAGGDFVGKIAIGGADDARVGSALLGVADAAVGAVLEELKSFGLKAEVEFGDFVEEERAVIGEFDIAGLGGVGVGEGAFFVAEEFAFKERAGNRGAVDFDAGAGGEAGARVNVLGEEAFAGAVFALDEDGEVGGKDLGDHLPDGLHGGGAAEDDVF